MRRLVLAVLVILGGTPASTAEMLTDLTPEQVREAIAWGQKASSKELENYEIQAEPSWLINFDTPFLRTAQIAAGLKGRKSSITQADIPGAALAPEAHVYAHARYAPGEPLPNITYVRILKKTSESSAEVMLPTSYDSFIRRVPTEGDAPTRIARSFKAVFPLSALAANSEIRVLFETGAEEAVRIDPKLLSRVR